jgi:NAD(P) transhydrogenase subunit alpha
MLIGIPKEVLADECRVALLPERVGYLVKKGHELLVESGAGLAAFADDAAYTQAGAKIVPNARELYTQSDLVLKVRAPGVNPADGIDELSLLREGSALIALLEPLTSPLRMKELAARQVASFSLESMPRITRAQSMDVLSSMATVAGYRAALLGATYLGKFFPLLMTAAGTVTPAKVLVLGAGVAGLQGIATARRLGAVVQAFDTRPVVREQVESLGASFLTLPMDVEHAQDAGGYARQLDESAYRKEQELLAEPVKAADVVITTAAIPGGRAPVLITKEMVASMRPGSVIIDLSAATGGNCELTEVGKTIVAHGVTIDAPSNLPASMPIHASQLFGRNLCTYVEHLLANGLKAGATGGKLEVSLDDDIVRSTCITYGGTVVHRATKERLDAVEGVAATNV